MCRFPAFILLLTLWSILFPSCTQNNEAKKYKIAFSQCIGNDAWRETMLKEMKRELSFHPEVEFIYKDAEGSNEKQIEQVNALLDEGIDLLIISPNEAQPLTPIVDSVFQQGIPVIVTDRKTSSGLYNAYVGADNFNIGFLAGQYLAHKMEGKGSVAEVTGLPGSSATIERQRGFREALKPHPKMQVSTTLNGQWLKDTAAKMIALHTQQLAHTDAVFAFNDQMALGTRLALQEKGVAEHLTIMGVDALPGGGNGLDNISKKLISASMLYATGGKEAIQTAIAILQKTPYQRDNMLHTLVIDSSNVELMKMQADRIDNQQKDIDEQQKLLDEQAKIYRNQQSVLNILVLSLVLAIVFAGVSFYLLKSNWDKNKHLEHQNAEIRKQQQQLIEMNERVREASQAKINFFTNISHEFKTPLTLILAPIEELLRTSELNASSKDQLLLIKRNALRLFNLVSELIDLQRLESEKLKLRASSQNIQKFLHQIAQSFKPLSMQKNIPIQIENKSAITHLWFDADLMEKVMYNLLSNAFKFTPKNGRIIIRIEQNTFGDYLMIRVIDNGKGISKAHIEHIFDTFYQGEYSTGGSGIGLALVKDIIELHHGNVTVSSKENEGTAFALRLPVGDAHLSDPEKSTPEKDKPEKSISEANLFHTSLSATTQAADNGSVLREHALLIIDDNEEILQFLQATLGSTYHIYSATNADDGLRLAFSKVPDLIISDVVMPGKSGIELVKNLKNDTRTSSTPIILLSAMDTEEQINQGLMSMADTYLTKPFNVNHLKTIIRNLIKNRQELKQRFVSEIVPGNDADGVNMSSSDRRFLNDLSAVVEQHLSDSKFGVEAICKEIGVSRVQLYRKVKALLDCSVNDYIVNRRLKKSKHLLKLGTPINEIAYQTGFSSPTYFATLFKNKYGISPSAFKKQQSDFS